MPARTERWYPIVKLKSGTFGRAINPDSYQGLKPDKIKPAIYSGASVSGNEIKLKIPAFPVVVLELK